MKNGANKRSKGWAFLISEEFTGCINYCGDTGKSMGPLNEPALYIPG